MEWKGLGPGEQLLAPLRFDEPSQSDSTEKSARTQNLLWACSKPHTENQDRPCAGITLKGLVGEKEKCDEDTPEPIGAQIWG